MCGVNRSWKEKYDKNHLYRYPIKQEYNKTLRTLKLYKITCEIKTILKK